MSLPQLAVFLGARSAVRHFSDLARCPTSVRFAQQSGRHSGATPSDHRQALCSLSRMSLILARDDGLNRSVSFAYFAGWPATYGRPNFSAVPIAGCLTSRPGNSIHTNIPAVSAARFAGPKSTPGRAIMIFSIGRSIRRTRPSSAKGGDDQ
jgi:hypothetical protein